MSSAGLEELRQDLEEYEQLHKTAKRPKVQENLAKEIEKLRREIINQEAKAEAHAARLSRSQASNSAGAGDNPQGYLENITNYAWDQSDKFMKLYLTLGNLSVISDHSIEANFTDKSVTVKVHFPNKTCQLHIARLCEEIVPKDCYCKKKSEYVLVMLKKEQVGKTWPWVTEREKKAKEKDKPKFEDNEDPSDSITKLLKNMYDDGDDEMKRTISKAFYESQKKQASGANPMDDL